MRNNGKIMEKSWQIMENNEIPWKIDENNEKIMEIMENH